MKNIIVVVFISTIMLFADDFVIGSYGVDSIGLFGNAHDSLGLNTVRLSASNYSQAMNVLSAGDYETLKVILGTAPPVNSTFPRRRLSWYTDLWHKLWECEENAIYFSHPVGKAVLDTAASHDSAWVCSLNVHQAGIMQTGRWHWQLRIPTNGDSAMMWNYAARYRLKIDNILLPETTRVCSLAIYSPDDYDTTSGFRDSIFNNRVVTVSEFQTAGVYHTLDLSFIKKWGSNDLIWYVIYWYDNVSLWADYVEAKDCYVDSLVNEDYNTKLATIAQLYSPNYCQYKSLFRFYLRDEPYYGHFPSNAYVMEFLDEEPTYQKGIQAVGASGKAFYQEYADSINPNELLFDYYPFYGAGYNYGRTPEDGGDTFQIRLNVLRKQLSDMRSVALSETLDFWYIPQSFGKYACATAYDADSGGNEGDWRLPTQRELRCNVWLGLAYGAKGIMYFRYKTRWTDESGFPEWMRGLWRYDNHPREPLYSEAKSLNLLLKEIGPSLLSLTSDTVFKSDSITSNSCNISYVSDTLMQIGTFYETSDPGSTYFIIVNRHCFPSESLEVLVGINSTDSLFLYDCHSKEALTSVTMIGPPPPPFYFNIKLKPGEGRLLRLVPFVQDFRISAGQTYANMLNTALITKAWSTETINAMEISQIYNDTTQESTGWLPYDTAYCWRLLQGSGTNTVRIKYKIDGSVISPIYFDTIVYDIYAPTGSFVINNSDTFTNTAGVTLKASYADERSNMSKMRYGNQYLKNVVKNSAFDDTSYWQKNTGVYDSTLKLFKIPVITDKNYFYQAISAESLSQFDNDTMLLWIDLVSDSFVGTGYLRFQYVYDDDTTSDGEHPCAISVNIPNGIHAYVSHYNLVSYLKYHPTPDSGKKFVEARVGIFINASAGNKGKLYIDNLRCDVVSPYNSYSRFETYDSLKSWTLTSGNGVKKVYGQFSDGAGNETDIVFDTIIVDTTKPVRKICSPYQGQIIDSTIEIKGWAYDNADPQQHFKQYELYYRKNGEFTWYGIFPDSIDTIPVNFTFPPRRLGYWNTDSVTAQHGDGGYDLRLTVRDSATNYRDTVIYVNVDNSGGEKGMIAGFSNYVYGISAGSELYIGEIGTGKIYRYNENYQLIDTFKLVDSSGIGNPIALVNDDSGKLWIANIESHTINRFSSQGNFEYRFGGNLSIPSGIAFDHGGNIWVSDRLHHKIKKFSPEGESLFAFGEKGSALGKIDQPLGIDIYDNKLYIADSKNKRISVFDTLGDFVEVLADSAGLSLPFGIVIDSTGCFSVSDFQGNKVIEFDPWGSPLYTIDSLLDSPSGLALSSDQERLYISDTKHKRVLEYVLRSDSTSGGGPQSNNSGNIFKPMLQVMPTLVSKNMMIRIQGMAGQRISLRVYDPIGRLVKILWDNVITTPNQAISWNGKDSNNRILGEGVYFIMLDAPELKQTRKIILIKQ